MATNSKAADRVDEIVTRCVQLHVSASELRLENAKLKAELAKLAKGSGPELQAALERHGTICCW